MEHNIDCMKYRKSTHLAGVDVEAMIDEKGSCILTIKDAYYAKNVDVSGNKTDGYFLEFVESVKPMMANSGNRKTIASIVKKLKKMSSVDSRNIGNWIGLKIDLVFDPGVKMMGQVVGGIKVSPTSPIPEISDDNAIKIIQSSKSLEELKSNYEEKLTKDERLLPTVVALKERMKSTLK